MSKQVFCGRIFNTKTQKDVWTTGHSPYIGEIDRECERIISNFNNSEELDYVVEKDTES